jgi:serine/threonine protein kinase
MPAQYVGRTFGRYRVVEAIGAGGMGEVYRARDEHLNRDVAVKCLSSDTPDESRGRMRREAHALSKLNHPNIATVHDFGHEDGVDYVVMEFIRGVSLADRLKGGPLAPGEAISIAEQVAAGIEEAHAHGLVHRDLKPGNVMLTTRGQVKVVDFGVAWHAPDLAGPIAAGAMTRPGPRWSVHTGLGVPDGERLAAALRS